jgi:hypothetical protein
VTPGPEASASAALSAPPPFARTSKIARHSAEMLTAPSLGRRKVPSALGSLISATALHSALSSEAVAAASHAVKRQAMSWICVSSSKRVVTPRSASPAMKRSGAVVKGGAAPGATGVSAARRTSTSARSLPRTSWSMAPGEVGSSVASGAP